jgi:hypothetical protein
MNVAMPAPERRRQLDAFGIAFGHLGYGPDYIRPDWRYSKPAVSNGAPAVPGRLDAALFHDPREHDYSTIAFAVELDRQDLVRNKAQGAARARELFERTVAPHVVLGGSTTTDVWMNCHGTPTPILDVALQPEAMIHALDQHRSKLERAALARLRGGQGVLFDRLYEARREELAVALNEGFSLALRSHPAWRKDERRALLSRAAIALLAARILEDKSFLASPTQEHDARRLLNAVEAKADGFFSKVCRDLDKLAKELGQAAIDVALRPIMAHLTGPISFSLVTPEMLGSLYETALIPERTGRTDAGEMREAKQKREANYIHYTPHTLTKHILQRLPIEEIRQSRRRVLDMACGSGSFLLAATERLSELYDAHEDMIEPSRVAHLRSRVIGYDTDGIALLVTRLTYLLGHWAKSGTTDDLPEPTCAPRDAMGLTPEDFAGERPTVIVGNPPFESGRTQLANRFLGKALDLLEPGGLLGMILPLGFLKMKREGSPEMRRRLLETCDLLEVWELPSHAVGLHAEQETCVVLARRHGEANRPGAVLFKQTYSRATATVRSVKEHLRSARTFAASGMPGHPGRPWSEDPYARLIGSPLDAIWQKTEPSRTLKGMCEGFTGIDMVGAGSKFSATHKKGMVPYMRHQAQLRPYYVATGDWCLGVDSPDSKFNYANPSTGRFSREKYWPRLREAKVIVTLRGTRNQQDQFVAAYDPALECGVFPEDDFACLSIWQDASRLAPWANPLVQRHEARAILMWIAAILNSSMAQAWIAMRAAARGFGKDDLASFPLPEFDPEIPALMERLLNLPPETRSSEVPCWALTTRTLPNGEESTFEDLVGNINHRIAASYGLDQQNVEQLKSYLREMTDQWVDAPEYAHLPRPGAYRRINGTVVAVDVVRQELTFDLPRYRRDGPLVVPLPRHIPGWALTSGAEFTCSVPIDSLSADDLKDPWLLRDFMPVPYSYLNVEELERLIGYERPGEHAHGE